MSNNRNGSGKGINRIYKVGGAVVCKDIDPSVLYDASEARGLRSKVDGTVRVKLLGQDSDVDIDVIAGVKELYDIEEVKTGGSISLDGSSLYLFW